MSNARFSIYFILNNLLIKLFISTAFSEMIRLLKFYYEFLWSCLIVHTTQVGPKMRDLRVKDFDQFEFKPKQLVQDICQVYINLGPHESFCRAVSGDGRSYSPSLFVMADRVLKKIIAPMEVVTEMSKFASRVKVNQH